MPRVGAAVLIAHRASVLERACSSHRLVQHCAQRVPSFALVTPERRPLPMQRGGPGRKYQDTPMAFTGTRISWWSQSRLPTFLFRPKSFEEKPRVACVKHHPHDKGQRARSFLEQENLGTVVGRTLQPHSSVAGTRVDQQRAHILGAAFSQIKRFQKILQHPVFLEGSFRRLWFLPLLSTPVTCRQTHPSFLMATSPTTTASLSSVASSKSDKHQWPGRRNLQPSLTHTLF